MPASGGSRQVATLGREAWQGERGRQSAADKVDNVLSERNKLLATKWRKRVAVAVAVTVSVGVAVVVVDVDAACRFPDT